MPPRQAAPVPKPPDLSPEKTLAVLKKQLAALDNLRGKDFQQARNDEREWINLTLNIITRGFGDGSNNVRQFHHASSVGEHRIGGVSTGVLQHNFSLRIDAFGAALRSNIAELELMIPEAEIAGAYDAGDEYRFYKDLKVLVALAIKEIFIIDNYLDTQLFDVYMENVALPVVVRVLTNRVSDSLRAVAEKFAARGGFELRSSADVHDRVIFADDRCWVIGQSIKDAAKKKPTYIVEHEGSSTMRGIYESTWASATPIVKG